MLLSIFCTCAVGPSDAADPAAAGARAQQAAQGQGPPLSCQYFVMVALPLIPLEPLKGCRRAASLAVADVVIVAETPNTQGCSRPLIV